jgi:hypothetical protein
MRKALIVGINKYPNSPLTGSVNDANAVNELIARNEDGSKNFEVQLAVNVPTKENLLKMIDDLFRSKGDTALFYYSGHGLVNTRGSYIVTPDQRKYSEGVSMDEILHLANKSEAKDKVIILDCCNAGAMGNPAFIKENTAHIGEGVTILASSLDTESSWEYKGHGVFTSLLLAALEGGAANIMGDITLGSIYAYIDKSLGQWGQRPAFKTNVFHFNSIRNTKLQIPLETIRNIVNYFDTPESDRLLDPSFEDTNTPLLSKMPKEPYANAENVKIFKDLQQMQSVGLVIPKDASYMYFAAMNSTACSLTPLGKYYWKLVKEKKI